MTVCAAESSNRPSWAPLRQPSPFQLHDTEVLRYAHLEPRELAVAVERVVRAPVNLVESG